MIQLTRNSPKALATALISSAMLLPMATPASAAYSCPAGSTWVGGTTCETTFTQSGTFTVPAGVTKLEALLVGGGGAGNDVYGGGGGDVKIVELSNTGDVIVQVGVGGSGGAGGSTDIEQGAIVAFAGGGDRGNGSRAPGWGGTSGSGLGTTAWAGAGAGGLQQGRNGGPGLVVSDLTSTLFLNDDSCYGGGGASHDENGVIATCGGGYYTNLVLNTSDGGGGFTPNTGSVTFRPAVANSGGGGGVRPIFNNTQSVNFEGSDGAAGKVVFRFTGVGEELADTGSAANGSLWFLSAGLGLAGIGLMLAGRRKGAVQ